MYIYILLFVFLLASTDLWHSQILRVAIYQPLAVDTEQLSFVTIG